MEEDPLAALLDQMAAAQRGGQPSEDSGKAPVVGEKRGKAKGRHGEGSSSSRPQPPEPPPSAEELSIYRPDVQVSEPWSVTPPNEFSTSYVIAP